MRGLGFWRIVWLAVGVLLTGLVGKAVVAAETASMAVSKPGIIIVAFGTSIPEAQKVFDHIMQSAQKRFVDYDIMYGYTARSIVKTLREEKRDHGVLTLEEAITEMKKRGHSAIVLQSLHVSPGQKDAELKEVDAQGMKVVIGKPLLDSDADLAQAVKAVESELQKGCPNVFCGHGNDHHPEYNAMMIAFNKAIQAQFPGSVLCTVEGQPGSDVLRTEVKREVEKVNGKIHFIPMMIVAGDHIINDVSGEEADSWKNIVGAKEVTISKPLGYNDAILAIFWEHLAQALKQAEGTK